MKKRISNEIKSKAQKFHSERPQSGKADSFSRTGRCVFCTYPVELKPQKKAGMYVICRFCGSRIFLNSQLSEIAYYMLEIRLSAILNSGETWFSAATSHLYPSVSRQWTENLGMIKPVTPQPERSPSLCPFCGKIGKLCVGKGGTNQPTFGCDRCGSRVFFRGLSGFVGFQVHRSATEADLASYVINLATRYDAEICGLSEPLTRAGVDAKRSKDEKERKALDDKVKKARAELDIKIAERKAKSLVRR